VPVLVEELQQMEAAGPTVEQEHPRGHRLAFESADRVNAQ
jgi:hypothetical protein